MLSRLLFALSGLLGSSVAHVEPTYFLLVRHGETDWNKEKRYQGQVDIPLNAAGIAQAQELAKRLIQEHPDVSAIYSSDLSRAYVTALQAAEKYRLPIVKKQDLREMNWGALEGLQHHDELAVAAKNREAELKETVPDRKQRWDHKTASGAESYNVLAHRMRQQLSQIAEDHPGEKILIFSHGRAITSLVIDAADDEAAIDGIGNCSVVHMTFNPKKLEAPLYFHRIEHSPID